MAQPTRTQSLDSAVHNLITKATTEITAGALDKGDLFKLTGKLMEAAERENLTGNDKKLVVMQSLRAVADDSRQTQSFMQQVMPELIDMLKFTARGGLQLALSTQCCGLIRK